MFELDQSISDLKKQVLIGLLKVIGIEKILDDIHTGEILEPVQRRIKNVSK